jgi:hypothetical protein
VGFTIDSRGKVPRNTCEKRIEEEIIIIIITTTTAAATTTILYHCGAVGGGFNNTAFPHDVTARSGFATA